MTFLLLDNAYKRNHMSYKTFDYSTTLGRRDVVPKGTELWPDGVIPVDLSNIKCKYNTNILSLSHMKRIFYSG